MPEPSDVDVQEHGGVLRIRLDRAGKKNAITSAMYSALADALERLGTDSELRVGLLEGEGADFCAGNDLFDFVAPAIGETEAPVARFLRNLAVNRKPLVAAVTGKAVGVGATMLLHSDLCYVSADAELRFPFVDLGLVPEAGSTMVFPALAGRRRAAEALLLCRPIDAPSAVSWGIANAVCDDPRAVAAAAAAELAGKPADALASTKALLAGSDTALLNRLAEEGAEFARLLAGPEFAAALERFSGRGAAKG